MKSPTTVRLVANDIFCWHGTWCRCIWKKALFSLFLSKSLSMLCYCYVVSFLLIDIGDPRLWNLQTAQDMFGGVNHDICLLLPKIIEFFFFFLVQFRKELLKVLHGSSIWQSYMPKDVFLVGMLIESWIPMRIFLFYLNDHNPWFASRG